MRWLHVHFAVVAPKGMPQSPVLIVFIGICAFFIIAKMLRVEKGAAVFGVVIVLLWVALHFTGYDKTIYHILFEAPPVQPEDYRYR
jgi:hypothetical protein